MFAGQAEEQDDGRCAACGVTMWGHNVGPVWPFLRKSVKLLRNYDGLTDLNAVDYGTGPESVREALKCHLGLCANIGIENFIFLIYH
jgi:hypothetical protein